MVADPRQGSARASPVSVRFLTGSKDLHIEKELAARVAANAVPNNKHHVYTASGSTERAAWERTSALQHRAAAGENVAPRSSGGRRGQSSGVKPSSDFYP